MDLSLKAEEVRQISVEEFNRRYMYPQRPLVIRGLAENTEAGRKWSLAYFKESMGDIKVDLYDNGNNHSESAYTKPDLQMRFGDYLDILLKNEATKLRIFLFNMFKFNPNLRKEFPCPNIFKGILDRYGLMFFGGKGTTVRIHYDIDMSNVLHTQFGGRKRVILISPEYSKALYCLPLNTYSLINPDNLDYNTYPALRKVKGYEIILEHGDSVYMPSGYWHYMTYLDAGFSVSYRMLAQSLKTKLIGIVNLAVFIPVDKSLNWLMGSNWLKKKKEIADKRASKLKSTIHFKKSNEKELKNF